MNPLHSAILIAMPPGEWLTSREIVDRTGEAAHAVAAELPTLFSWRLIDRRGLPRHARRGGCTWEYRKAVA